MAKQARMECVDRISNLPDPVLTHILSFLLTKEAVKTSVLSTRWVKVFTLTSNLMFDDHGKHKKSVSHRFMSFVDRVLFHRKGDVDKFHLKFVRFVDPYRVDGWIRYALSNRVREIVLQLKFKEFDRLPLGLFSCKTVEVLKLYIDKEGKVALNVPVKSCSPRLKILHLSGFKFSDENSVGRLFSSCSVLEELVVEECIFRCKFHVSSPTLKRLTIISKSTVCGFVIDATSLVYFKFYCLSKNFLLKNLNSLVEADIKLYASWRRDFCYKDAAELVKGISNVHSLHLSATFCEDYQRVCSLIGELPNVTYLKLNSNFFKVGCETVIPELLSCFPCLEELDIEVRDYADINRVMLPSKESPSFLWSQLKKIKILSFKGEKYEFQMIEYFLKNAQVLENLIIQKYSRLKIDKRLKEISRKYKLVSVV